MPNGYQRTHLRAFDPDRLLEVARGGHTEHYLLSAAVCDAELERWEACGVSIDRGWYDFDVMIRGTFRPGFLCIGRVHRGANHAQVNGVGISDDHVQIHPEGSEFLYRAHRGTGWTAIQIRRDVLQPCAERLLGRPLDLTERSLANLRSPPPVVAGLTRVIESILSDARGDATPSPDLRALTNSLLDAIVSAVDACSTEHGFREHALRARRRIAMVHAAQDFLRARDCAPYDSAALCESLGIAERTLQLYFRQTIGMSPRAWYRSMRLHRARRLLTAANRSRIRVTDVALRCGFDHFGRFAADYRRLFAESPS